MTNFNTSNNQSNIVDESFSEIVLIEKIGFIVKWIVYTGLCQTIALIGIGTNITNVICFVKQGFKDPVNVSLLGMAVSDLGSLITLVWITLWCNPSLSALDLPFDAMEIQYLIGGIPHCVFTCITAWITALITFERCLCITSPLKIKTMITSRRVAVVVVCIFIIIISGIVPVYAVKSLGMKYFPDRNKTLIGLVTVKDREHVENAAYIFNNVFLPFCAFIVIIVCTITLAVQLKIKAQWRKKSTSSSAADNVSNRNQKVARMVVIISSLFIACFVPNCFIFVCFVAVPGFSITGKYKEVIFIVGGFGLLLESINSSANIIIYYRMSSKYKAAFREIFCSKKSET